MNASFYNGVGGVKTAQFGVDVWGDNIANMNTTGYKAQKIDFHTLFANANMNNWTGSTVGGTSPVVSSDMGVSAFGATTTMDLSQGSIQQTDNPFDLSVQGKGFFEVEGENGERYFSRTGSFVKDANGILVNGNGENLLGIDAKTLTSTPATAPAVATNKIEIKANIQDGSKVDNKEPASINSDFGVLYNENGDSLKLEECQNFLFGFGDVKYEKDFLTNETIIKDDKADGKPVNINFTINGKQIKVELPDGTKKKDIINAVITELGKNGVKSDILTDKSGAPIGITIKDKNKISLHNNKGDFFKDSNVELLTFKKTIQNDGDFSTMESLIEKMQKIADKSYPYMVKVDYKDGKIVVNNNSSTGIKPIVLSANNSNSTLIKNLGDLSKTINPNETSSSKTFNNTKSILTGEIIDRNGNKNQLKIEMVKIGHKEPYDKWSGKIYEIDKSGNIISQTDKEFTFVKDKLMSPTEFTIDNSENTFIKLDINSSDSPTQMIDYIHNGSIGASLVGSNGKNWSFNSAIPTDKLLNSADTTKTTPLNLPSDVIFPAEPTKKVQIAGNLKTGDNVTSVKLADENSDMGVLYGIDKTDLNIKNGQDIVFGFGNDIQYENGLLKIDECISDDIVDTKPVKLDFNVNDINIKLVLPDGSSKDEIIDAIANELHKNNILYEKINNGIQIKAKDKLIIQNNSGENDFIKNASAEVLTYKKEAKNSSEFTTMGDFKKEIQSLADNTYPNIVDVEIEEGKFFIHNNSGVPINSTVLKTENSNENFANNLGRLGNIINGHTASNSLTFNMASGSFGGGIIDKNGNQNKLKLDFVKIKSDVDKTTWEGTISEIAEDGKTVLSTKKEKFVFDSNGLLIKPKKITIDNNGTETEIDFASSMGLLTSFDRTKTNDMYSQDGMYEGHLNGYQINERGEIIADFSNGKSGVVGAIPLFHFQNEQGLDSVGGGDYTITNNSGNPIVFKDGNGDYLGGGVIKSNSLEMSNVKASEAMTQLIIMQKAYSANSKSITTSDQMVQKAIDMKR